jgi:hypothetical protein
MKHTRVLTGVLAAVLLFGSALAGWPVAGDEDGGGIFTLTDIPAEYHGKYAMFRAVFDDEAIILGAQAIDEAVGDVLFAAITGERMNIPLWLVRDSGDSACFEAYTGNDSVDVGVEIFPTQRESDLEDAMIRIDIEHVTFTNGNATASWKDGRPAEE